MQIIFYDPLLYINTRQRMRNTRQRMRNTRQRMRKVDKD